MDTGNTSISFSSNMKTTCYKYFLYTNCALKLEYSGFIALTEPF